MELYISKLNAGDIVPIFLNHHSDDKKFEGNARLIKRLHHGDTHYLDYEELYVEPSPSSLSKNITKYQRNLNLIHKKLSTYFKSTNPLIRTFLSELKALCFVTGKLG